MDPKDVNLYGHVGVLLLFILWIVPLIGGGATYFPAMVLNLCIGGYTIKANYGSPPTQGFSMSKWRESLYPVQLWMQKVMQGAEIQYMMFTMVWLSQAPNVLVAVIIARRSLWTVCTGMASRYEESRVWGIISPVWTKLKANELQILEQCVFLEIALGFLCIFRVVTGGMSGILSCYMQWSFLKMRYNGAYTNKPTNPAAMHKRCWSVLHAKVEPVLTAVPVLNTGLSYITKWFTTMQ